VRICLKLSGRFVKSGTGRGHCDIIPSAKPIARAKSIRCERMIRQSMPPDLIRAASGLAITGKQLLETAEKIMPLAFRFLRVATQGMRFGENTNHAILACRIDHHERFGLG
jgi:hypothetical protein